MLEAYSFETLTEMSGPDALREINISYEPLNDLENYADIMQNRETPE